MYRDFSMPKFSVGEVVCLNSSTGGRNDPRMTVIDVVERSGSYDQYLCSWFNSDRMLEQEHFLEAVLTSVAGFPLSSNEE